MNKYICIHGHFYQPPRENPWLETIEKQDSASPYHDWNERVTAEAYAPNAKSRILDDEGRIRDIVNNYSRLSFNFGPTLLRWIESENKELYEAILEADKDSMKRFDGHGSALAQPYHHMIMPLANTKDKYTQVRWGIKDFKTRFGRDPEGMWLPETAVDIETLEIMAELGVKFTLLSPHQLELSGKNGDDREVISDKDLDTTRPYAINLSGDKKITVFPYDGELSNAIAFEGLLKDGKKFARRLINSLPEEADHEPLLNVATDGETYGHHHKHGDMALAYALREIENDDAVSLTNYGQYLAQHPPEQEAEIRERTSWSCSHGVERWKDDCGCSTGGQSGWNQKWRAPLRDGLNQLRDDLEPLYEEAANQYLSRPWEARDHYIDIVLNRSDDSLNNFFSNHAPRELTEDEKSSALKLLELQRHLMLMFTSCGWFFADISDIGTVQILRYADRAIQLADDLFNRDFLSPFMRELEKAKSNKDQYGTGRDVYDSLISPARVSKKRVAAHYAILALFEGFEPERDEYSYQVNLNKEALKLEILGDTKLALGEVKIDSKVTRASEWFEFGVIYFGEQNLSAGIRQPGEGKKLSECIQTVLPPFEQGNLTEAHQKLTDTFGPFDYSLSTLFSDDQRRILDIIIEGRLEGAEEEYRRMYEDHLPLMRYIVEHDVKLPYALYNTAEYTLNANLRKCLSAQTPDLETAREILNQMEKLGVEFQDGHLEYVIQSKIKNLSADLGNDPRNPETLDQIRDLIRFTNSLPLEVDFRELQTTYYRVSNNVLDEIRELKEKEDTGTPEWVQTFLNLAEDLGVRIEFPGDQENNQ
ncbi:MAG: DUF3536 domain-containing protein [Candidatus Bipolaricaulia bacterium]